MSKILILALLGVLVFLFLKRRQVPGDGGVHQSRANRAESESMVSCAYCKLHIPMTESLKLGSRYYCSEEHRRLHGGHGNT